MTSMHNGLEKRCDMHGRAPRHDSHNEPEAFSLKNNNENTLGSQNPRSSGDIKAIA